MRHHRELDVANVLLIDIVKKSGSNTRVKTLVSDVEGRFALVDAISSGMYTTAVYQLEGGVAYLHNDLSSLMKWVKENHDEEVPWLHKTDEDDGRNYITLELRHRLISFGIQNILPKSQCMEEVP